MPIAALRSIAEHFPTLLRSVQPHRLVAEMARADRAFHFRYFKGYRPDQLGRGRLKAIADKEIFSGEGHELFANLLIVHWNDAHAQLFRELVTHIKAINEDVEAIERIEDEKAHTILDDLLARHDRVDVLLVTRLNGVRFDPALVESRLVRGEPRPATSESGGEPASGPTSEPPAPAAQE